MFFLVEFKSANRKDQLDFADALRGHHGVIVDLGLSDDTRYATMFANKPVVAGGALDVWDTFVSRVELSLPLKPTRAPGFVERNKVSRANGDDPVGSLLLGVIDDGCPFAAAHFLKRTSGVGIEDSSACHMGSEFRQRADRCDRPKRPSLQVRTKVTV